MRKKTIVTIRDVAAASRVSVATVSDVLNCKSRRQVATETRHRIVEAARKLGYQPTRAAQSLRTGLNHLVALMTPALPDQSLSPFFHECVAGAFRATKEREWMLTLIGYRDKEEELALLRAAVERRAVDGVVFGDPCENDPRIKMLKGRLPFVVLGRYDDPEVFIVDNDNVEAAKLVTQHFLQLGHRHIGFVHVPLSLATAQDRLKGYKLAFEEAGLSFDTKLLAGVEEYTVEAGHRALQQLLERVSPPPTAVVAMDDNLAIGIIQAAQQHRLRVPHDLAVVGFNNCHYTNHCEPPLTSVRVFAETLGYYAVDTLVRLVQREPVAPRCRLVPTQLILRESCGASLKHEV